MFKNIFYRFSTSIRKPFSVTGIKFLLYFIISIFCSVHIFAKNDLPVDNRTFVCETHINDISNSLNSGAESFLFNLVNQDNRLMVSSLGDKNIVFTQVLSQIHQYLKTNNGLVIPIIIRGDVNRDRVSKVILNVFSDSVYFKKDDEAWPSVEELLRQNIKVVALFEQNISLTTIQKVKEEKIFKKRFSSNPLGKMVLFSSSIKTDTTVLNDCFTVWNKTGRVPNFIVADSLSKTKLKAIGAKINDTRRFQGVVYYQDTLFNEVYWKHLPGVITPARFTFPILKETHIFTPYKYGYRISPGEVIHNTSMQDDLRIFTAFNSLTEEKQKYDFSFENSAINNLEKQWQGIIEKDVSYVQDNERGNVLHLSKPNSFIDYGKENTMNLSSPISVSVWVKPDRMPRYMGIIGIGKSFSLKLKDGSPDFTTATLKDYAIKKMFEVNKWHHIVAVFNPNFTVRFYIDGEKQDEIFTSEINPSNHSLVIGNNVWGEQFYGSIDDLKVWNRGLSDNEVAQLYQTTPDNKINLWYGITISFLIVVICAILYIKRKKTIEHVSVSKNINTDDEQKVTEQDVENYAYDKISTENNGLCLFGSFTITSKQHVDLSSGFSPLLRQLLSFMILYANKTNNGVGVNILTETFWPGAPKDRAKENRRANIKKLRKALIVGAGIEIVYREKKWFVQTDSDCSIDFIEYNKLKIQIKDQLVNAQLNVKLVQNLLFLLKRGNILQNIHAEWLDDFKNRTAEEVIELLHLIYKDKRMQSRTEDNIRLSKTILLFDQLNEEALFILIKELVGAGKHGQAKNEYQGFAKNYMALYNEVFPIAFQDIVERIKST